jgi:tetratricopeptide (TPR) repeat protein
MDDNSSTLLTQQAISAALSSEWQKALELNQQIIQSYPNNVDALNRAARAYFELGDLDQSKKHYQKALEFDPYNQIAFKFLKRIEACRKKGGRGENHHSNNHVLLSADMFIEEPGKTKVVNLLKVAEPQRLSLLSPGTLVNLVVKNRGVSVTDPNNDYLGVLPDDLSHQLIRLIKGGNHYQALLKTIKTNSLTVLIRETHRSARFRNQPSFLDNMDLSMTYSSDHIVVPADDYEESPAETAEEES